MLFTMILLIGSTFAENIDRDDNGDNGGGVWFFKYNGNWDNPKASVYAYLYMDVLDGDGNQRIEKARLKCVIPLECLHIGGGRHY